jgi:hypothetical protein
MALAKAGTKKKIKKLLDFLKKDVILYIELRETRKPENYESIHTNRRIPHRSNRG